MDHVTFAQLLGDYGEFVGAIAVFVTLGYLAVQVRQSKEATLANTRSVEQSDKVARAQVRSAITDQIIQINKFVLSDPVLYGAQQKSLSNSILDEAEFAKLRSLAFIWIKHAENVHYQYRQGLYDKEEYWAQAQIWRIRFREPAWHEMFQLNKALFSPAFVEELERIVEDISNSAE